ncbi:MAG TPA: site-2 protease family protein [Phycisphaerae bacterium]|nr:site-2 protease family protein [Phycisphaerae bacterium]
MSWEERDYANLGSGRGTGGFGMYSLGGGRRFADNPLNWSPTIGRLFGIRVRVHIIFIIYCIFELIGPARDFLWSLQWIVVLFGSVFLHELGHCFAARRVGGSADDILMWPLGGLASVDAPQRPWPQFVTVIWGPLVNVILFLATSTILLMRSAELSISGINPLDWITFTDRITELDLFFHLAFSINVALFIFNLFPMYPMDGGRMLHCALWNFVGRRRSTMITTTVGMVAAIGLGLYGLATSHYLLLAIAFMGYLTCYQERILIRAGSSDSDFGGGFDYAGAYSNPTRAGRPRRKGMIARWRENAQRRKREARQQEERQLELSVDQILDKVHREGMQSLTRREKQILEEASRRQRSSH